LTVECEVDSELQISAFLPFWDFDKSIVISSGIAAFFDGILITGGWPDGRDHRPVLGFSKLLDESCDAPESDIHRTPPSTIQTTTGHRVAAAKQSPVEYSNSTSSHTALEGVSTGEALGPLGGGAREIDQPTEFESIGLTNETTPEWSHLCFGNIGY